MNSKQTQLLNLIRKINIEKDALFHSKFAILDLNLEFDQTNLISQILDEHQKNLTLILELVKKLYEKKED